MGAAKTENQKLVELKIKLHNLVDKNNSNGCWLWKGYKDKSGYGRFQFNSIKRGAHVISYEIHNNIIVKSGQTINHKCNNPSCINPDHLYLGTQYDNMRDTIAADTRADVSGERNPASKLKSIDIPEIISLYKTGNYTQRQLADKYNISQRQILRILHRKSWAQS